MRLKNVEINLQSGIIDLKTLDLHKSSVIVISGGVARITELPDHGETKVITHQGKVKRVKWDEGEDF